MQMWLYSVLFVFYSLFDANVTVFIVVVCILLFTATQLLNKAHMEFYLCMPRLSLPCF